MRPWQASITDSIDNRSWLLCTVAIVELLCHLDLLHGLLRGLLRRRSPLLLREGALVLCEVVGVFGALLWLR